MKLTSSVFKRKCSYYSRWFFCFVHFRNTSYDWYKLSYVFDSHRYFSINCFELQTHVPIVYSCVPDFVSCLVTRLTPSHIKSEYMFFRDFLSSCNECQLLSFKRECANVFGENFVNCYFDDFTK